MGTREKLLTLDVKKTELEQQIAELYRKLNSSEMGFVGLEQPLVDKEGFPRSDIDIYAVRNTRHKLICLRNDLKQLMSEIEMGLIEYYSNSSR